MTTYTREEQAEHRAELVAALRSGKYKQGRGAPRRVGDPEDLLCCLGVACDISGLGKWIASGDNLVMIYLTDETRNKSTSSSTAMPLKVQEYYGFANASGATHRRGQAPLMELNDTGLSTPNLSLIHISEPTRPY